MAPGPPRTAYASSWAVDTPKTKGDFFRVGGRGQPVKSQRSTHGTLERCRLPGSQMAKVELRGPPTTSNDGPTGRGPTRSPGRPPPRTPRPLRRAWRHALPPLSLAFGCNEDVTQDGAACNASVASFTKARSRVARPASVGVDPPNFVPGVATWQTKDWSLGRCIDPRKDVQ